MSLFGLVLEWVANFITHHWMIVVKDFTLVHFLSGNFELRLEVLLEDVGETLSENELVLPELDYSLQCVEDVEVVLLRAES